MRDELMAALRPRERVLDIACGTRIVAHIIPDPLPDSESCTAIRPDHRRSPGVNGCRSLR
jgi:ubiquinone/menaquinone biosynthesis C-methylase UbiE